ncbi:AAA family ATPase [Marinitoga sp. 1155]|uniref:AAA family ATPase n=1 Tax=Marinitoga sp. 1155 TaxID=1428448 RepID=UPI0006414741|nr:ATP-binding protein [Marinitoga sp. 1155]KLO25145.1 hypothetical protein X274_00180 [Marinitoga sp. 1155]
MERLKIKNFIILEDVDIELKAINIFIGKQSTGKSLISKLIFFFKNIFSEMFKAIDQKLSFEEFVQSQEKIFLSYFYSESYFEKQIFEIRYEFKNIYIIISNDKEFHIYFSKYFEDTYNKLLSKFVEFENMELRNNEMFILDSSPIINTISYFVGELKKEKNDLLLYEQIFIPAGRAFYSILTKNIFSIFENVENIKDQFIIRFGRQYETLKNNLFLSKIKIKDKETYNILDKKIEKILNGHFIKKNNEEYIELEDGKKIKIFQASSGQQEILPLVLFLQKFAISPSTTGRSVYIEEPETHLFPETQNDIIELVSLVYNMNLKKMQFFITTHSPYLLVSFNNLIMADYIYSKALNKENINKIINRKFHLSLNDISAYLIENGKSESIIKDNLIDAEIIDNVSDILSEKFDSLLEWNDEIDKY